QSTLPRRERPILHGMEMACHISFNPRSREGSDVPKAGKTTNDGSFNPRSREGSDVLPVSISGADTPKFQSTLPRRERPAFPVDNRNWDGSFNPRSREGSD